MCHVPLVASEMAALFQAFLEETNGLGYVDDIDLTYDLGGHLDYASAEREIPDVTGWRYMETSRCGT
jgi:hypothetical protein